MKRIPLPFFLLSETQGISLCISLFFFPSDLKTWSISLRIPLQVISLTFSVHLNSDQFPLLSLVSLLLSIHLLSCLQTVSSIREKTFLDPEPTSISFSFPFSSVSFTRILQVKYNCEKMCALEIRTFVSLSRKEREEDQVLSFFFYLVFFLFFLLLLSFLSCFSSFSIDEVLIYFSFLWDFKDWLTDCGFFDWQSLCVCLLLFFAFDDPSRTTQIYEKEKNNTEKRKAWNVEKEKHTQHAFIAWGLRGYWAPAVFNSCTSSVCASSWTTSRASSLQVKKKTL